MKNTYWVITFFSLVHCMLSIYYIRKGWLSVYLSKAQKYLNTLMVILLPFLWIAMLSVALSKPVEGTSSKTYRDTRLKPKYKNHGNGAF